MIRYAKHWMRENRNNQYRPEQIEFHRVIRDSNPNDEVLMEYTIKYTNEQDKNMVAVVDVVNVTKKIAYRLNGAIHNSSRTEEKDWEQKEYLEKLGWKVEDIEIP